MSQLRESRVLESRAEVLTSPVSLRSVPIGRFASRDGVPFTLGPHTETRYLSQRYTPLAAESLCSIGVSELSAIEFLQDLDALIVDDTNGFHARPAGWHSQLATALFYLTYDEDLVAKIEDLPIIPLKTGKWVSAKSQAIFFSRTESDAEIPSGIHTSVVDPDAESDFYRRKLFESLGVGTWQTLEICELIVQVHGSPSFEPETLTTGQLVSHTKFLWKASWEPRGRFDLWFATTQGKRSLGKDLYIPRSIQAGTAAARIFARLQYDFPVIHEDYLKSCSADEGWNDWLECQLKTLEVPRLVSPQVEPKPKPAAPESLPPTHLIQDYQWQMKHLEQLNARRLEKLETVEHQNLHEEVQLLFSHESLNDNKHGKFNPEAVFVSSARFATDSQLTSKQKTNQQSQGRLRLTSFERSKRSRLPKYSICRRSFSSCSVNVLHPTSYKSFETTGSTTLSGLMECICGGKTRSSSILATG